MLPRPVLCQNQHESRREIYSRKGGFAGATLDSERATIIGDRVRRTDNVVRLTVSWGIDRRARVGIELVITAHGNEMMANALRICH